MTKALSRHLRSVGSLGAVLALAALFSAVAIMAVKESPWQVLLILLNSSFGSADGLSLTLFYTTPLLLTGAAVLIPLRAGLFNIGAEGQLYMGALAAAVWGLMFSKGLGADSSLGAAILIWIGGIMVSFGAGAAYAALAAWLRTARGVHEVISTIMMNFMAMALANWAILYPLKNPETQSVETSWISEGLRLGRLWLEAPASLPLALFLAVAAILALRLSWWGYRVRVCGENPEAGRIAGIAVNPTLVSAMAVGGGLAGVVGFHEIFCGSYRLIDGFSPQFGFTGIAIALLCRGSLPGFLLSCLFFGALHKGTLDLDLETENITRDFSFVIQAILLVCVAGMPRGRRD